MRSEGTLRQKYIKCLLDHFEIVLNYKKIRQNFKIIKKQTVFEIFKIQMIYNTMHQNEMVIFIGSLFFLDELKDENILINGCKSPSTM